MNDSQAHQMPCWTQESCALHDLLCQARVSTSPTVADELQHQLLLHKQKFIHLLDDAPKSSQDRSMLQGGKAYINRVPHKVNDQFIKNAIFISDQLGINEHVASTLLMAAMGESQRVNSNPIDTAVLLYHTERGFLLACFDVILKSAKDSSVNDQVQSVFRQFIADLMQAPVPADATNGTALISLPAKILATAKKVNDTSISLTTTGTVQRVEQAPALGQPTAQLPGQPQAQQPTDTTNPGTGRLGVDITAVRMERLVDERIYLFQILYHLASLFWLESKDVLAIVDTLEKMELSDIATPYLLLALLAALSTTNHAGDDYSKAGPLYHQGDFMKQFHDKMTNKLWKVPTMKSVVVIQWVLFLVQAIQADRRVEAMSPATEENIEKLIDGAIATKVFDFMNDYLLYFQQPNSSIDTERGVLKLSSYDDKDMAMDGMTVDPSDFTKFNADINQDFQTFVVYELEQLAVDFIENLQSVLRKMKYHEEDTNTPVHAPLSSSSAQVSAEDESTRCRDMEAFYSLLASIYRDRINAGYKFWMRTDNRLFGFIKWTTDIKLSSTLRACYDFFASISTGDVCAQRSYQFFELATNRNDLPSSSLFSWGKLFAALHFYVPLVRNASDSASAGFPVEEELLLRNFLNLFKQVIQYSSDARIKFWSDPLLRCPETIVEILSGRTSVDLRAVSYQVLAAFCSPWGGGVGGIGRQISAEVWGVLENSNFLISKRETDQPQAQDSPTAGHFGQGDARRTAHRYEPPKAPGFLQELELEQSNKVYNETLAVLNLLGSAIHTQTKREELISGFEYAPSTVPWDLGKGTRTPGAAPYISLVIDHVFVTLDSRAYLYPGSKWQLAEACLKVFENSVRSFDLRPFQEAFATMNQKPNFASAILGQSANQHTTRPAEMEKILLTTLTHPGFEVIVRMLSGNHLLKELFKIVERGPEAIKKNKEKSPYFTECVVRCLRIFSKVLEIQDTFCNALVPMITSMPSRTSSTEIKIGEFVFPALPSLAPLGQLMLYHINTIVQIALLVDCGDQEEICYLSTKILQALSKEPNESNMTKNFGSMFTPMGGIGTKLTNVLRTCTDQISILYGFSERLSINDAEITTPEDYEYDINNIPFWRAAKTLQDTFSFESDFQPRITSSIRLAIMDLLVKNADSGKPSPSLSDYLLGFNGPSWESSTSLYGQKNQEQSSICFRSILDLLRHGVTNEDTMTDDDTQEGLPLIATHPILAEKCYQLIYRLCSKDTTSGAVVRYLRSKEDFVYSQLKTMSARIEGYPSVTLPSIPGVMICADGTRVELDFFTLLSQLHQRAWLLKTIALELHLIAGTGQKLNVIRLLELLYGRGEAQFGRSDSLMDIEQEDGRTFSFHTKTFQQPLVKMLEIVGSLEFDWVDELAPPDATLNLQYFKDFDKRQFETQNERGCIIYDIRAIYKTLRHMEIARRSAGMLTDAEQVAVENEMGSILQILMAENHAREIANGKLHCLHAWKQVVQVTLSECFDLLPFDTREKIIYAILSTLLPRMRGMQGIDTDILKGFSEVILTLLTRLRQDKRRQEILAATPTVDVQFATTRLPDEKLQIVFTGILDCVQENSTMIAVRGDMYTALVNFLHYVGNDTVRGEVSQMTSASEKIQKQFIEIIGGNERFLNALCSDACDGLDIWKTTAFIALDALYVLSVKAGNKSFLSFLVKKNFLRYTIDMIRREDVALLNLLEQVDASLTPLYIYEAKMSFFLRLALYKDGAKLLLENRIIDVLSHCQYISARPEPSDQEFDFNQRYEQLLLPVLKLITALMCSQGRDNGHMLEKIEVWVRKQQEALLYILRDEQKTTLTSLTQLKIVTSLLYHLSCRAGFFNDLANRGLNQLHTAMTHLIAKYLLVDKISAKVTPTTDEEKEWAKKHVNGDIGGALTIFESKVEPLLISIQMNLVGYSQNAAFVCDERGNNTFRPVFSNILSSQTDMVRNVSLKAPSLSTLVSCIRSTVAHVQNVVAGYRLIQSYVGNVASLKFEDIRDIAESPFSLSLGIPFDQLTPSQQHKVLAIEVENRAKAKLKQIRQLSFIIENALLMLWRHLEFYMQPALISPPASQRTLDLYENDTFGVSLQSASFQPSIAVASNLRSIAAPVLQPVLKKLETLDLVVPDLQATLSSTLNICKGKFKLLT